MLLFKIAKYSIALIIILILLIVETDAQVNLTVQSFSSSKIDRGLTSDNDNAASSRRPGKKDRKKKLKKAQLKKVVKAISTGLHKLVSSHRKEASSNLKQPFHARYSPYDSYEDGYPYDIGYFWRDLDYWYGNNWYGGLPYYYYNVKPRCYPF
ncbi:unnamed protein product, partial [Onchocerca ochengi]|uniref:Uncharacterized protein n=1 Tax=Onchocerca ochengi TaxID=42157 RepID=A0A182EVF2_ONCOC